MESLAEVTRSPLKPRGGRAARVDVRQDKTSQKTRFKKVVLKLSVRWSFWLEIGRFRCLLFKLLGRTLYLRSYINKHIHTYVIQASTLSWYQKSFFSSRCNSIKRYLYGSLQNLNHRYRFCCLTCFLCFFLLQNTCEYPLLFNTCLSLHILQTSSFMYLVYSYSCFTLKNLTLLHSEIRR